MTLTEDEEIKWWSNPSITPYLPIFFGLFLGIPMSIALYSYINLLYIPLVVIPISVVLMLYEYLKLRWTYYVVTDQQIIYRKGVIAQDYDNTPIYNIQQMDTKQNIPAKLLGYGDIIIETAAAGEMDALFKNCPSPQNVVEKMWSAKQDYRENNSDVDNGTGS
jgi:uncharacterized membrane protein YdbT with pleckstrin-like domain